MRSGQLIQFIIDNPTLLKRPIIIDTDENKMQIGFNEEDIREFIPNKIKHAIVEYYLADTPEESNWEEGLTEDEKVQAMSLIETTFTKKKDKSDSYDDDEDYVEVDEEDEIILDGDDLNEDID
jgi:arsenate reductase-like glutaredoxin family protein